MFTSEVSNYIQVLDIDEEYYRLARENDVFNIYFIRGFYV